jgi:hypothetical protein
MTTAMNPFPGARPYRAEERGRFFGRERVAEDVYNRVVAYRCLTIYGPSGAGKSSILYAKIIPRLEEIGDFRVVCVTAWPEGQTPASWLIGAIHEQLGLEDPGPPVSVTEALDGAIKRAMRRADRPILFVLDQFEQLLMPTRTAAEFAELLDAIEQIMQAPFRGLHVTLTLREDYLGRFRDRARGSHAILERSMRIGPLTVREMADAAVQAAKTGVPPQEWHKEQVTPLMREVRWDRIDESEDAEVHAAFGQIVCTELWNESAESFGHTNVKIILQRYYAKTVERHKGADILMEHLVDKDANRKILTEKEAYGILKAHGLSAPLAKELLNKLENDAILSTTEHQGSRYFEISHDWLAQIAKRIRVERERHHKVKIIRTILGISVTCAVAGLLFSFCLHKEKSAADARRGSTIDTLLATPESSAKIGLELLKSLDSPGDFRDDVEKYWECRAEQVESKIASGENCDEAVLLGVLAAVKRGRFNAPDSAKEHLKSLAGLSRTFRYEDPEPSGSCELSAVASARHASALAILPGDPQTKQVTGERLAAIEGRTLHIWGTKRRSAYPISFAGVNSDLSWAFDREVLAIAAGRKEIWTTRVPFDEDREPKWLSLSTPCSVTRVALSANRLAAACKPASRRTVVLDWALHDGLGESQEVLLKLDVGEEEKEVNILSLAWGENNKMALATDHGLVLWRGDKPSEVHYQTREPAKSVVSAGGDDFLASLNSGRIVLARWNMDSWHDEMLETQGEALAATASRSLLRRKDNTLELVVGSSVRSISASTFSAVFDRDGRLLISDAQGIRRYGPDQQIEPTGDGKTIWMWLQPALGMSVDQESYKVVPLGDGPTLARGLQDDLMRLSK